MFYSSYVTCLKKFKLLIISFKNYFVKSVVRKLSAACGSFCKKLSRLGSKKSPYQYLTTRGTPRTCSQIWLYENVQSASVMSTEQGPRSPIPVSPNLAYFSYDKWERLKHNFWGMPTGLNIWMQWLHVICQTVTKYFKTKIWAMSLTENSQRSKLVW